jgi:FkbM family methyltransferase
MGTAFNMNAGIQQLKRGCRVFVTRVARRAGYEVTPRWQMPSEAWARRLRHLFAKKSINTVVDVGANEGQFATLLRQQVGFQGSIISFEPNPPVAERLLERSKDDKLWTVVNCALGSAPGVMSLNLTKESVFTSFLTPMPEILDRGGEIIERVQVRVSTLDTELPHDVCPARTFLKLDTQGFDLEVLAGATDIVRNIPLLQVEVSFLPIYEGMPGFQDALARFESLGFVVADLFLVATARSEQAYEFDCIMVRPG